MPVSAHARLSGALLVTVLLHACAPPPYQADSQYLERARAGRERTTATGCRIALEPTRDERHDRKVLGNVAGKTVLAADDPDAWMRSVLSGLESRGVAVRHLAAGEPAPDGLYGRPRLIIAWVTNIATNKNANVVMRMEVLRNGASVLEQEYRGAWTGLNWSGSDKELQKMIDRAFGQLLDRMAADLLPLCASP